MNEPIVNSEAMNRDPVAFPQLTPEEIACAQSCGQTETIVAGSLIYVPGQKPVDCLVVVDGEIEIIDTSGDQERLIVLHRAGGFIGDINAFIGRSAVVTVKARTDSTVIRLRAADLRQLLVRSATLGEKCMLAFIRRRELLNESGFEGLRVFGKRTDAATLRLRSFFDRNGVPHHWIDSTDTKNLELLKRENQEPLQFPLVAWSDQILLQNPSLPEIAKKVGVLVQIPDELFDTVIIGSGPAGLGAAVYAASEGLRTLVLDGVGPGGQAGASSRIENYAGFPAGLSGSELALRTYLQSLKFGATFSAPCRVTEIRCLAGELHEVVTEAGEVIRTKTVIISSGVSYRDLPVEGFRELQCTGIYYSATQTEAMLCADRPVHIIGAGNSAGQAAMFLSKFTPHVQLIVRGAALGKSMSSYLSERVIANPRIHIRYHSELRRIEGTTSLDKVHVEETQTGQTFVEESNGVFVFIGALPCTEFLGDRILKDEKGFILTGPDLTKLGRWPLTHRPPGALETSCPGIFAAGDCRAKTTKRVAAAVGDGALAVTCVHDLLGTYS